MNMRHFGTRLAVGSACVLTSYAAFGNAPAGDAANAPERPTYSEHVAPILYANCAHCHRPGEVAPMSLLSYDEARPWAAKIKEMVAKRLMPPWYADPAHGTFRNDVRLSESEVATIVRWVDKGALRGDPSAAPEPPSYTEGWQLGEPDFILELPEVNVPAEGSDYFPNLTATLDVPERRWVRATEVRAGNSLVTHHVVVFNDAFGGGMGGNFDVLAVWAVGSGPQVLPDGVGRWVEPGQRLRTNMHYHPNGTPQKDRTRVGLYFGEGEVEHELEATLTGSVTFQIPPGAGNHRVDSTWYVPGDIKLVSMFPHMHLRGKDMRFTAVYPDGREEILLNVPQYDFDWQLFYYPEQYIDLPAGARIDILAHYDNSEDNPNNPDPTRSVGFGLESTDEMMFGMFEYFAADGGVVTQFSDAELIAKTTADLPQDEVYSIDFALGEFKLESALHLPRTGEGNWYLPFEGQVLTLPIKDVAWDESNFTFDINLQFGHFGGAFTASGFTSPDGNIAGKLQGDSNLPLTIPFVGAIRAE